MKNMKIILSLVLALSLTLCLCACGGETAEPTQTEEPEVTAPPVVQPEKEEPTEAVDDGLTTYTVTIVDENGNPIPGAMVQLCKDTCYPGVANENGVATFKLVEADYKVSFLSLPAGFTYSSDAQEFYFESGSVDLTIALKAEG